jgi:hypothetical protein
MCGSQVSCEQHLLQKIDYDKTAYEEMSQPTSKNHIEEMIELSLHPREQNKLKQVAK